MGDEAEIVQPTALDAAHQRPIDTQGRGNARLTEPAVEPRGEELASEHGRELDAARVAAFDHLRTFRHRHRIRR